MTTRGNCVGKAIQPAIRAHPQHSYINDWIIYAIFARLTLSNNDTIEFDTTFNQETNTIELCLPEGTTAAFNHITGAQRGPNFKRYIDWLIGSDTSGNIESQFKEYQGYKEYTYDGSLLAQIDLYLDNSKANKLFTKTFSYTDGRLVTSYLIKYETNQTTTKTFTYSGGRLINTNTINT